MRVYKDIQVVQLLYLFHILSICFICVFLLFIIPTFIPIHSLYLHTFYTFHQYSFPLHNPYLFSHTLLILCKLYFRLTFLHTSNSLYIPYEYNFAHTLFFYFGPWVSLLLSLVRLSFTFTHRLFFYFCL